MVRFVSIAPAGRRIKSVKTRGTREGRWVDMVAGKMADVEMLRSGTAAQGRAGSVFDH
jgi:hypothetical protein